MKPKVLHVTQATGGVETSLLLLFRHLDPTRFELHLACPPKTGLAAEARALGVRVFEIPMVRRAAPLGDLLALVRLVRLIRRERYAIVHGHSAKGGYLARLAARLAGRAKTIYHPRAFSYLSQRGLARRFFLNIERLAVRWTDVVIATSESERRRAIAEVGCPMSRVVVIPNSVDFADLERMPAPNGQGPPLVLTVGRLSYQKNPEMFVRVAALVAARNADVRFMIAGAGFAGPLEAQVRRLGKELGLESRLALVPWMSKPDVLRLMRDCSVFVLTSRFEGMPNTVLEAMMMAKPVVVTDVDGTRDAVHSGTTGYIVAPEDEPAMTEHIMAVLADPALARRLGAAGRLKAYEEHDILKNACSLGDLYQSLIAA